MNMIPAVRSLVLGACVGLLIPQLMAAESPREHLSLDANWKFHLGDDWPGAAHLENSGTGSGPAGERFADSDWRVVNVPHDWAIELPFDPTADGGHGFKALGGSFPRNSVGWYRRKFDLPASDSGKRIWLTFDGVYRDAAVWVNGWFVRHHEGGYYPFREDVTDLLRFGGTNTISVRVDATKSEGWFYEGAGIYRHVWLDKTAPIHLTPDSTFITTPEISAKRTTVHLETRLANDSSVATTVSVMATIYGPPNSAPDGSYACGGESPSIVIPAHAATEVAFDVTIPWEARLWSPEKPDLHSAWIRLRAAGETLDDARISFGIRTVGFDATNGFLLNGKHYELYGTCNHQDHAGVGAAIPDALQEFRVKQLKAFGCNAIRTSHNPPTPELLEVCDRLGLLVMDESRLMGSDSENMKKWDDQIRRDRNHASVAIWCIANEQFAVQDTPQAGNVARTMQDYVKQLDPTRPVTYAAPEGNVYRGINSVIEVRGWNYHYGPDVDKYHAEHPGQPNVGTEQASVVGTRGIYTNDRPHGYVAAYDVVWPGWTTTAESWWSFFAERPWLSGGFVWTGFDYRGEPTPYGWPCINSHFGILDTCGFPKDVFYYYQSWWTTNTVLHLLPHWNWPGREGSEILVEAFSNCRQVELFLNGASLGKQEMKPNSKLSWQVKYAPGTLSAKGFDANGQVIAETKVETTGDAAQIQLIPDRKTINADGKDVAVFTVAAVDAQGRVVPVAQNKINFAIAGAGKIIGVGNGDPSCHEPDTFIPKGPVQDIAVNDWRWKLGEFSTRRGQATPEFAPEFDDSSWGTVKKGDLPLKENETAIYRAHVKLTPADLDNPNLQIHFSLIDDNGWVYVNNQRVGESHDWNSQPVFEARNALHAGDNVIAVGVKNDGGAGGLSPEVFVEVVGKPQAAPWSRSLFNGLAQIIVQSTREAGELTLTASSDSLKPATAAVQTQAFAPSPSLP